MYRSSLGFALVVGLSIILIDSFSEAQLVEVVKPFVMSPLQQRKWSHFYNCINAKKENNPILTIEDYSKLAENIVQDPEFKKFTLQELEDCFVKPAFAAFPKFPLLKDAIYIVAKGLLSEKDQKTLHELCNNLTDIVFRALDFLPATKGDNCLTLRELETMFRCIGVDPAAAYFAFPSLDENHDDCLTYEEFRGCAFAYLTSEDVNHRCNAFLGPVPENPN